jgi:dUTP pyrophosphatase
MPNAPGTIDADYRGEINVLLINHGSEDFVIRRGDRIAQMIINKVERVDFRPVDNLPDSQRGDEGFGSTGVSSRVIHVMASPEEKNLDKSSKI